MSKTKNTNIVRSLKSLDKKLSFQLTEKQINILQKIKFTNINSVIIDGPAGTSKTLLAVLSGLELLGSGEIERILYLRTAVESAQKSLGFRPGSIDEKFSQFTIPLRDKLDEILGEELSDKIFETGKIEAMPINDIRGSSWRDCFVIFDECQNASFKELVTTITRVGVGTKIIFIGDEMQSDIKNSGWTDFLNIFSDEESEENGISSFYFYDEDVVRSDFVKFVTSKIRRYYEKSTE